HYFVNFEGLPGSEPGLASAVAVTAVGSSSISCSVTNTITSPKSTGFEVDCIDAAANSFADSQFNLLVVGNRGLPAPSAFADSGGTTIPPPTTSTSWTTGTHPLTVTHGSTAGDYAVVFGTGNAPLSGKLATATSNSGSRCTYANGISGGMQVRCFDSTGA